MFSHANNKPGEQHLWHGEQSRVQSGLCQVPGLEKLRPVPVSLRSPTSLHGAAPDTSPRTWSQCWGRGPSAGDVVPVPGLRSQCRGHAPGRDQQQVARCKAPVSCSSRCCMAVRIPSSVLSHCGTDSSKSQPEARGATARYFPSKTHAMLWLQTSRFDFIGKECCEPGFREQFISRNFFPW